MTELFLPEFRNFLLPEEAGTRVHYSSMYMHVSFELLPSVWIYTSIFVNESLLHTAVLIYQVVCSVAVYLLPSTKTTLCVVCFGWGKTEKEKQSTDICEHFRSTI